MRRRKVLGLGGGAARLWDGWLAGRPHRLLQCEKSKLKIDGLRLARTRAKRPAPRSPWNTGGVEVANPMSIYAE